MTTPITTVETVVHLTDEDRVGLAECIEIIHSWVANGPETDSVALKLSYLADLVYYSHLHSITLHGAKMREPKQRIRNFRISESLNQQLKDAADLVGTDPSCLLRDFVREGTSRIIEDEDARASFRQRYA